MLLKLVLRGQIRALFTPGRMSGEAELHRALTEIRRTHPRIAEKMLVGFALVAGGVDPRDVADECTKLGEVMHWRWGDFRVAWFWSPTGQVIVLEAWRKQGAKERRERIGRLNRLRARFEREDHEFRD